MMTKVIKVAIMLVFLGAGTFLFVPRGTMQTKTASVETAGQKFKNIKVLNDMPAEQMGKVMNIMAASLGVNCKFCHVSDTEFEKDGNEHKDIARQMITMTFDLNKKYFDGHLEVTCNTCHQGRAHPNSAISFAATAQAQPRPAEPKVKPTIESILENYVKALGGQAALDKIKTRTIKAQRVEPDGTIEPEEIFYRAPNKMLVMTAYGKYIVAEAFDGGKAWKTGDGSEIALKADETEQVMREAQLMQPGKLKEIYAQIGYALMDRINGREVFVVRAATASGSRERLYFDAVTGLLVRRTAQTPTMIGNFTYQVDYEDYKDFDGVKIATLTRWNMPAISWTRKVIEVKNNTPVDDAKFKR